MRRLITFLTLLALFVPGIAHAKRKAQPKVEPVIYEGVRYTAPNDDGRRAYVQAWDTTTNKMLWEVTVFRNFIVPLVEEDVQHVYIKRMSIEDGKLILFAEDDRAYSLDLKTRVVKKLKQTPPEKTRVQIRIIPQHCQTRCAWCKTSIAAYALFRTRLGRGHAVIG